MIRDMDKKIVSDGTYVFRQTLTWNLENPRVCWILHHPIPEGESDPERDAAIYLSQGMGYGSADISYLFGLPVSVGVDLGVVRSPIGPGTLYHMLEAATDSEKIFRAWGDGSLLGRDKVVLYTLKNFGFPTERLGVTEGHPSTPLDVVKERS